MAFKLTYKPFGERAILVEWPQKLDRDILNDLVCFKEKIVEKNIKSIIELKSAYNSLLVFYDDKIENYPNEVLNLKSIYLEKNVSIERTTKLWKIPVCYDDEFGIDLEFISKEKRLSKSEIIKRHCQVSYSVYFIGFLPGFLYLGGLDKSLEIPRKSTPRLHIEKGAVAIGGSQTGVYPNASPGGWNIIGNSPINFFDVSKDTPCFAKAGDRLKFYPVTLKEYHDIKTLVDANVYQLESEVVND
ncbi:MAG: 5-oxoprolinase subunit PxpB [Tamlana sp.]